MTPPTFTAHDDPLDATIKLSHFYGGDPSFVLAGGGNTSVKLGDRLLVKGSGSALASINRDGFVEMDRHKLDALANSDFGSERTSREARYKEVVLAARVHAHRNQRPSVEALLHHLVPGKFVVHTHSTIVNAVTCSKRGAELTQELFGDDVLWVPFVDPGFALGQELRQRLAGWQKRTGRVRPRGIFMGSHGLIVSADDPAQIHPDTQYILGQITARLGPDWQTAFAKPQRRPEATKIINTIGPLLRGLLADGKHLKVVTFDDSDAVMSLVHSEEGKTLAALGPVIPDQIVYCNSFPLWFEPVDGEPVDATLSRLREAVDSHAKCTRFEAKVVLVKGVGLFAAGDTYAAALSARDLYIDAIRIMSGATRLGGIVFLAPDQREFFEQWEVEAYRKGVAKAAAAGAGRMVGKVGLVTGAAQGFGVEIARAFGNQGGHVALADVNAQGAGAAAADLCAKLGKGRAMGLAMNVTDSASIAAALHQVVRQYGGFDVLVSNAGVLRAGSVKDQPEKDFDFVTSVNYKGYFLCVQQAAPILALQHKARPGYLSDIIQINSKSGLQGSNRNGAYAGSKFGGVGLTQSFALELIEDGIKVNAVCPGNFFDGPLWSDPTTGLFVQYLRTGKVPGAKSVADVAKFYEAKVPMGRGTAVEDVMAGVYYLIDQQYETGQALPVTGGQVMLS